MDYDKLRVAELKKILEDRQLETSGVKKTLIKRLRDSDADSSQQGTSQQNDDNISELEQGQTEPPAKRPNTGTVSDVNDNLGLVQQQMQMQEVLAKALNTFSETLSKLASKDDDDGKLPKYTLETAMSTSPNSATTAMTIPGSTQTNSGAYTSNNGVPLSSLGRVELVPPAIREAIVKGKDVNLSFLLIPFHEMPNLRTVEFGNETMKLKSVTDPRALKHLTITEFIKAFGTYKSIMCEAFECRRKELDDYQREIVEMASQFPGTRFYNYHLEFSAAAAAHLRQHNRKVDWGIRDDHLYYKVFAGCAANCCEICQSPGHDKNFCPQKAKTPENKSQNQNNFNEFYGKRNRDNLGRLRVKAPNGREICNHYNALGCQKQRCNFYHACRQCFTPNHAVLSCPQNDSVRGETSGNVNHYNNNNNELPPQQNQSATVRANQATTRASNRIAGAAPQQNNA